MKPKAILTFDLDFWHSGLFMERYAPPRDQLQSSEDQTEEWTEKILNYLNQKQQLATFFVLGEIAQKYPALIKKISAAGHEIACHGLTHRPLWQFDQEALNKELYASVKIISDIIGKKPKGFRAPNFSLNKKTFWAVNIIGQYFDYDSSPHPLTRMKNEGKIREVAPSLGGYYFRVLPLGLFIFTAKNFSKFKVPVFYFHPYEFFQLAPPIKFGPAWRRKIKYLRIKNAWQKFKKLGEHFDFISIEQYLNENPAD